MASIFFSGSTASSSQARRRGAQHAAPPPLPRAARASLAASSSSSPPPALHPIGDRHRSQAMAGRAQTVVFTVGQCDPLIGYTPKSSHGIEPAQPSASPLCVTLQTQIQETALQVQLVLKMWFVVLGRARPARVSTTSESKPQAIQPHHATSESILASSFAWVQPRVDSRPGGVKD
eukprot:2866411-Rhodomonas_salina.1